MEKVISVDADRNFKAEGTEFVGHGGPINDHEVGESRPALYEGSLDPDNDMTLKVTFSDTGEVKGTYSLTYGESPHVEECL